MVISEALLIAVVTGLTSFLGFVVANNKTQAVLTEKINQLEKKVDKHNNVLERTFKLESDVATAFHRIDELREDQKDLENKL